MSGIALIWAANVKGLPPAAKVVLIALADHHNKNTGLCFPSAKTLSEEAEMSRATVFRYLTLLEERGLITRRARGDDKGGRGSNYYELHLDLVLGPSSRPKETSQNETGGNVSNCDGKGLTGETGVVSNCDTNLKNKPGKNLSPQPPRGGRRGGEDNSFGVSEGVKQHFLSKYTGTGD